MGTVLDAVPSLYASECLDRLYKVDSDRIRKKNGKFFLYPPKIADKREHLW